MTSAEKEKFLPADLTSHDLIKSFAVIIMVIDHIGYYFYPDLLWFRAVGRVGFPIWFFLVGYSSGRDVPVKLIGGAVILLILNYVVGLPIFPLNALFTIIAIRLSIDYIMAPVMNGKISVWVIAIILLCLVFPSYAVTEYGTQALITAIFGYLVRHKDRLQDPKIVFEYMIFALITFAAVQYALFLFTFQQMIVVVFGTMLIRTFLYKFHSVSYPELTRKLPMPIAATLQFMGRRTLEIYIAHLALFKCVALLWGDDRFQLFNFVLQ